MSDDSTTDSTDPREQAIHRIKQKRAFQYQLVVYGLVNAFLWIIWAVGGLGFPWPIFVTAGWGIGIATQAWRVYGGGTRPITDDEIQREMQKGVGTA